MGGHLAKALTDLLIEPFLHCYRCGCSLDGIGVVRALGTKLNAPKQDIPRSRMWVLQRSNSCSSALPVEKCIAQQTRDLLGNLQTGGR